MGEAENIGPKSDKIKKALLWAAEMVQTHPEMKRRMVIEKAQLRFNLSPKECDFLNKNFVD